MTGETKAFASQCKLRKGHDSIVTMTHTELFEAPKSWHFFKDFFIPRHYFNQLDTISNVTYRHEIVCIRNTVRFNLNICLRTMQ